MVKHAIAGTVVMENSAGNLVKRIPFRLHKRGASIGLWFWYDQRIGRIFQNFYYSFTFFINCSCVCMVRTRWNILKDKILLLLQETKLEKSLKVACSQQLSSVHLRFVCSLKFSFPDFSLVTCFFFIRT